MAIHMAVAYDGGGGGLQALTISAPASLLPMRSKRSTSTTGRRDGGCAAKWVVGLLLCRVMLLRSNAWRAEEKRAVCAAHLLI